MIIDNRIDPRFRWFHEPAHHVEGARLVLATSPGTDFWQRTHYGFRRDNGHFLFTEVSRDFSLTVRAEGAPRNQYDQCGLMVRKDSGTWIKASTEYETPDHSRLGSVVTNLGYSDWATRDVHGRQGSLWYRIRSKNALSDFLLETSQDGAEWAQLRITHLHGILPPLEVGVYACSPMDGTFELAFDSFRLDPSDWGPPVD